MSQKTFNRKSLRICYQPVGAEVEICRTGERGVIVGPGLIDASVRVRFHDGRIQDVNVLTYVSRPTDLPSLGQLRARAHSLVANARSKGHLPNPADLPCADCDRPAEQYEHRDYRYPLWVDPVCRRCNLRRGPALPYYIPQESRR